MVGPLDAGGDGDGHADDAEEHEDNGPPCIVGEADQLTPLVFGAARGGDYGADEGDDPGKLHPLARGLTQPHSAGLTMAIEMVARAKGSPMMRPRLKVDRWP
jgi:hypothetical protein